MSDNLTERITRPDEAVRQAAMLRRQHYVNMGAVPLPWPKLADAQKLPWLLKAVFETLGLTEETAVRLDLHNPDRSIVLTNPTDIRSAIRGHAGR